MEVVETCVKSPEAIPYLRAAGYNRFLTEGLGKPARNTFELYEPKEIRRTLMGKKGLKFVKPLSAEAFRAALMDHLVFALTIDESNVRLVRREVLSLARIHNKPIELLLNHSSSRTISTAIKWGRRWVHTIFFSSCASKMSEVWPPLVKVNFLVVHGATEAEALSWVFHSPLKVLGSVTSVSG